MFYSHMETSDFLQSLLLLSPLFFFVIYWNERIAKFSTPSSHVWEYNSLLNKLVLFLLRDFSPNDDCVRRIKNFFKKKNSCRNVQGLKNKNLTLWLCLWYLLDGLYFMWILNWIKRGSKKTIKSSMNKFESQRKKQFRFRHSM